MPILEPENGFDEYAYWGFPKGTPADQIQRFGPLLDHYMSKPESGALKDLEDAIALGAPFLARLIAAAIRLHKEGS